LTDAQARQLEAWLASRQTPAPVALRCRIVLLAAQGMANAHIAERLGITRPTVLLWRKRFMEGGPQALLGETLAGAGGRLARVTETHVVVDGPDGQEKLFLTPAVEKRVAVNTTNRKRTRE